MSLQALFEETEAAAIGVADRALCIYHARDTVHPMFFHPGMAAQRILRMRRGQTDRLVQVANIGHGDTIVDATAGLGTDTLVFAEAVGNTGQVVAIESEPIVAAVLAVAKQFGSVDYPDFARLLARVQPICGAYETILSGMLENSVDVVYFDPMFEHQHSHSAGIQPLRAFANQNPISKAAFEHACRVARRTVVVKERSFAATMSRFRLERDAVGKRFSYGIWRK